jgi:glycerol kinase
VQAAVRDGHALFGNIDTWLIWNLTGGPRGGAHITDVSNASRTLLMDLGRLDWDSHLLEAMQVPAGMLPTIHSSSEIYGEGQGVLQGVPVAGDLGDQQAALFGQTCFAPGEAKCTYGTGCFLLMNTGTAPMASRHGLLTTVAWRLGSAPAAYALEGSAFVAGALVQWLRDGLGIIQRAADIEALARQVPDAGGVVVVPALAGLGAPHWRPEARGIITGITRGTTAAHLARAALEGIALMNHDLLRAMEADCGRALAVLKVDGGAAVNDLLMQFQADVLGVEISRPAMVETTALGAAFLAGLAVGVWKTPAEIARAWREERRFRPSMDKPMVKECLARWKTAVAKA